MTYIINFCTRAGSRYRTRRATYEDTLEICARVSEEGGTFIVLPPIEGGISLTPADVARMRKTFPGGNG